MKSDTQKKTKLETNKDESERMLKFNRYPNLKINS